MGVRLSQLCKEIFIGIAMSLFAVATVFNMNMLNENGSGDVSLDAIAVMAQAQDESNMLPEVTITCSSGDDGKCFTEGEPHHYIGPFGLPMCETTCKWTGSQTDFCAAGMPC